MFHERLEDRDTDLFPRPALPFYSRSQDADQLMEGLKSAQTMLSELRTSSLSPKNYYTLCEFDFSEVHFLWPLSHLSLLPILSLSF